MTAFLPTLKQLQYLVALNEHGHFGRAAKASLVSQSTLSAGIRELESLLGETLVERGPRAVRFTALGAAVAERANRVLREAEALVQLVEAAGEPLSGHLRLSVIPTIAPFLLPSLLPRLKRERPRLDLFLREETTGDALASLETGRADCVLLALPYPIGDLEHATIMEDRLSIALPRDDPRHPTAEIDPATIDEGRLLLLEDGHCLRDHALAACSRPELRAAQTMIGTSLHTLVQMVAHGLGVTLLPQMAIDAGILEGTGVVARPLDPDHATREIALVWRKGSPREDDFRLLAGELRGG